ncbi:glycosyltransferase family 4 protein [Marinobacter subterrani]|uniref:Glycosyltransferase involved in cell wall bisynthesis n=1 Tax=Marinobacter subterrani TaxID=1658765 RepID=A0A0J7J8W3_9GAMM|nr:glycosyltransferase family 4 protein [Marinobacter subterrani]KMQ74607.1 Glycosyltransferase involved in cell wall bisynthesis [Marinobacter subterrani]
MKQGNLLLASNYSSDTGYAWWLMEFFWLIFSERSAFQTTYLAYPKIRSVPSAIAKSSINTVELDLTARDGASTQKICQFIRKNHIKCLYLTDQPYFSWQYLAYRLAGVEHIIVHDHTPGDRPSITGLKGFVKAVRNRLPLLTADLVMNVSPLMRRRSLLNGRIPSNKCISIQNGIDVKVPEIGCTTKTNGQSIRAELNLPADSVIVVTASRMHAYKQVDFAIQTFVRALSHTTRNLHFLIIGNGPDEDQLKSMQEVQENPNRIHFLGYRNDVPQILADSDIAIHCAKGEGFSLSIIEYMHQKLPVLVPDTPSVSQALEHRKSGLIYQAGNLESATSCLLELAEDNDLRSTMGQNAKDTCLKKYTIDQTRRQFTEALDAFGI